jgi:NADH-quinone oxidoreductase subunit L
MTVPLVVLAVLSTLGGLLGVPYALSGGAIPNYFEHTLEPAVAHAPEAHGGAAAVGHGAGAAAPAGSHAPADAHAQPAPGSHAQDVPRAVGEGAQGAPAAEHAHDPHEVSMERLFSAISVGIALAGILAGWLWFRRRPLYEMPRLLENKYYVDEAYDAAVVNPLKAGSREGLWRFFDVGVIDGIVNGVGRGMSQIGSLLRYLQPGFVRSYAAIILLGALVVVAYFAYNFYQLYR